MSEDKILSEIHIWLWNNFPELRLCCWHVANERQTSKREGAILKAKGVVPGVPDYVVNYAGKTYYFELKTEKGVLSENQKKLHKQMKNQAFDVIIIRSFDEFKTNLTKIMFNI